MTSINIKRLANLQNLPLPSYGTDQSAGMDLYAAIDKPITIQPMQRLLVPNGVAIALQKGFEAQIRPRSGLAIKHGITVLNAPGTIDADYRGEICSVLINLSNEEFVIEPGMRIAQMVVSKYDSVKWSVVEKLDETQRGEGGFGSTGIAQQNNLASVE